MYVTTDQHRRYALAYDPRDVDYVSSREEVEFLLDRIDSQSVSMHDVETWLHRIHEKITVELADAAKRARERIRA
jgi:hypothetical protein